MEKAGGVAASAGGNVFDQSARPVVSAAAGGKPTERILVCVVSWNGREHLEYSIPSLLSTDYKAFEVLVVDNASTDGSVEFLESFGPKIRIIKNRENLLWAGGTNLGIKAAISENWDWMVLANNDIIIDPRWVEVAMGIARADPEIGIIGFDVIGEWFRADRSVFFEAQRQFKEVVFKDDHDISGCFLLLRCDLLRELGPFDEIYEQYSEENDFERRARRAGVRIVRSNLPIWHLSEGTSRRVPLKSAYLSMRNGLRLAIKHDNLGIFALAKWPLSMARRSCIPFRGVDMDNPLQRRMRPSRNVLLNACLIIHAYLWNIANIRKTLAIGAREHERSDRFRAKRLGNRIKTGSG